MSKNMNRRDFIRHSGMAVSTISLLDINRMDIVSEGTRHTPMPMSVLGRTGREVFRIGFGGGSFFWRNIQPEEEAERLIDYAIQLGVTYFDTAIGYGSAGPHGREHESGGHESEKRYGKFLTPKYRTKIFLVSKAGERTYDGVMKQFELSLKYLNTDYLDLYHMHGITKLEQTHALMAPSGGFKAFCRLKEEGVIKNIGFSFHEWNEASKLAYEEFDPDVVMCSLNAARDSGCEEHFLPIAKERNTGIVAMKTTAGNTLIGKVSGQNLVRYVLSLPVHVVNIGVDGFGTLESCVGLANEKPLSPVERDAIHKSLAYSPDSYKIPYHQAGYSDGDYA